MQEKESPLLTPEALGTGRKEHSDPARKDCAPTPNAQPNHCTERAGKNQNGPRSIR